MQSLMRAVAICYLIFLTALLLTADPTRLVGARHGHLPGFLQALMPAAHAVSFAVLSVLALMTRWPIPRWAVAVILVFYGGMTEIAQSFLPPRTADWIDWLQDVAGVAIGASFCWIVATVVGAAARRRQKPADCAAPDGRDDWDVVQNAMSRRAAGGQSWWV